MFENDKNRITGAAIVGPNAGDLIAECALTIEMAAEAYEATITNLYIPLK